MASRPRRPGFSRRAQYGQFAGYVVLVAGGLVAALLLAVSRLDPAAFSAFRSAAATVTTPISSGLGWATRTIASVPQSVADYFGVMQRNADLRRQIDDSRAQVQKARALDYENRRLKRLLGVRERVNNPVVTAHLVSSSASSTRRFAVLDAGRASGVAIGQPVRGPEGLIGRVVEVGINNARVQLITDPESIVPVRRIPDGLPAIAAGRGDGLIEIRAVNAGSAVFRRGDIFFTSGIGGIFSPNVPVARATRAARDVTQAQTFARADTFDFAIVERSFIPPEPLAERPR
ncbi:MULTISPECIES: rod shape-determining protein MreC [Sphingomonas]|uniref:rod shape-determining protein MreC n=1 Tax=Sphingomonas TaxID=13687 RepID=UPI00082E980B|nr:rod shape-determining protein MreC [Sphingomonas sp. CCH10-B3]